MMILSITVSSTYFEISFAQEMSPHKQWKKFADLGMITCNPGHLLLQKNNGNPTCVMPSTYLKLVDRGYGHHNPKFLEKHPQMMNNLKDAIASNKNMMFHWHEMMQNDSTMVGNTMADWVSQMHENPDLLKNMLGPMTSDPELREKMIQIMKNHPHMETTMKQNSKWMDSVHGSMMGSGMGQGMHHSQCAWCPHYEEHSISHSMNSDKIDSHHMGFSNSDRMMDMMHHMWINPEMVQDMHTMMLEDPSHMAMMSNQLMEPMLNAVMDDPILRDQMMELMLEHQDFMNSIRHENPDSEH